MREPTEIETEAVAKALHAAAAKFSDPVELYVARESRRRYEGDDLDKDAWADHPEKDLDLESWKILAKAVISAMNR